MTKVFFFSLDGHRNSRMYSDGSDGQMNTFIVQMLQMNTENKTAVISNDEIFKRTELRRISEEVKIKKWKWIRYVFRMEDDSNCITLLTWKSEWRRKVGRPRTTWRRPVEKERKKLGWRSWNEAKRVVRDRVGWRDSWATRPEEDRWGWGEWWTEGRTDGPDTKEWRKTNQGWIMTCSDKADKWIGQENVGMTTKERSLISTI